MKLTGEVGDPFLLDSFSDQSLLAEDEPPDDCCLSSDGFELSSSEASLLLRLSNCRGGTFGCSGELRYSVSNFLLGSFTLTSLFILIFSLITRYKSTSVGQIALSDRRGNLSQSGLKPGKIL